MSFAQQLQRLRDAAFGRQPGMRDGLAVIRTADLRELVHQFDRLDQEARAAYWSGINEHCLAHKCPDRAPGMADSDLQRPAPAETPSWREEAVSRLDHMAGLHPGGLIVGGIDRNPNLAWRNKPTDTTD